MRFYPKLSIENVHEIDEQNVLSNLSDENVLISNFGQICFQQNINIHSVFHLRPVFSDSAIVTAQRSWPSLGEPDPNRELVFEKIQFYAYLQLISLHT